MRLRLTVAMMLLFGLTHLGAQEHASAPAPKARTVHVAPSRPAAEVAAAVAAAMREAEAAEARRAGRSYSRPATPRPTAPTPARRYDVHWPEQRMVLTWPGTAPDRVTLKWPSF